MRTRLGRMSTVFGFGKIKCSSSALLSEKLRCRPGYGLGKGQVEQEGRMRSRRTRKSKRRVAISKRIVVRSSKSAQVQKTCNEAQKNVFLFHPHGWRGTLCTMLKRWQAWVEIRGGFGGPFSWQARFLVNVDDILKVKGSKVSRSEILSF